MASPTLFRIHALLLILALGMSVGWILLAYVLLVVVHRVSPLH